MHTQEPGGEQSGRAGGMEDLAEQEAMGRRQSRKGKPRARGAPGKLGIIVLVAEGSPRVLDTRAK